MSRNTALLEQVQAKLKRDILPELIKQSGDEVGKVIVDDVKANLKRGTSPVEGEGRFVEYSDSYKEQMKGKGKVASYGKKQRPVNLYLSGAMVKSLHYIVEKTKIIIRFEDPKAYIHTVLGAGKSKVIRKALPQGNENLSRTVLNKVKKILSEGIKTAVANIMKDIKY
jgi:hypothetical protein